MIVQLTRDGGREAGYLVIDDKTSRLMLRTKGLPAEVVLKAYLAAVREERTAGAIEARNGSVYEWEVLGAGLGGSWWKRRAWQTVAHV